MMNAIRTIALGLSLALAASTASAAETLPGFRLEVLGPANGYLTSLAVDSKGTVYYTGQNGYLNRFENGTSTPLVKIAASLGISDAGLLGMALLSDDTAAVHYTLPTANGEATMYDVVSRIDLRSGTETLLKKFACDVEVPERGASMKHHGGNPVAAGDGSFFVGLGEYGGRVISQLPNWNGGKIWRVHADGTAEQYVIGMRNPFDFVWDAPRQRLIIPDNGDDGDELCVVQKGGNCGYPWAFGNQPHLFGATAPFYVWTDTISPCGTIEAAGHNDQLRSGIIVVGFVSKAVHYFPDVDAKPLPDPLVVLQATTKDGGEFVDIAEAPDGTFYLGDGFTIYRLITPTRGDCDGDGAVNNDDLTALTRELADAPEARMNAQNGTYRGSWGCDVNGDDRIDSEDLTALSRMLIRPRAVRRR